MLDARPREDGVATLVSPSGGSVGDVPRLNERPRCLSGGVLASTSLEGLLLDARETSSELLAAASFRGVLAVERGVSSFRGVLAVERGVVFGELWALRFASTSLAMTAMALGNFTLVRGLALALALEAFAAMLANLGVDVALAFVATLANLGVDVALAFVATLDFGVDVALTESGDGRPPATMGAAACPSRAALPVDPCRPSTWRPRQMSLSPGTFFFQRAC
jgi:hypothetical protein